MAVAAFEHIKDSPLKYQDLECLNSNKGRRYVTPEGNKYPSITTVLGILSKDSIAEWRARVGEKEANRVSSIAAGRGTKIHQMCEDYLNNKDLNLKKEMPLYQFGFNTVKKELDKISLVYHQEIALYSDFFRIAGRVDLVGVYDGVLSIVDFKTSSKMKEKAWIEGYFLQTSFYAAAYYELTGIPVKQIAIIISTDEGQVQVFKENPFKYLKRLKEVRAEYSRRKLFGHA